MLEHLARSVSRILISAMASFVPGSTMILLVGRPRINVGSLCHLDSSSSPSPFSLSNLNLPAPPLVSLVACPSGRSAEVVRV